MRRSEALVGEDNRQERHHRHAAADAQQSGEKADDRAKRHEGDDQRQVHSINGVAWRASGRTPTPPGPPA